MQDENGNQCDAPFLIPESNFSGSGRTLKRSKSVNTPRIPCINLSPTPSPEEISGHESALPICLRRSSRLLETSPYGSFGQLPTELIYFILKYLPLTSIGHLGQTSKPMRDILIRWMSTTQMHDRLIWKILKAKISPTQKAWCGRLSLPREVHIECRRTGVLVKQLTCLFPTSQRLGLYYQLTNEVKNAILQRCPSYEKHIIAATAGVILHSMISGWDKAECTKVYARLCQWNNVGSLMVECIKSPVPNNGTDERDLRLYLRSLFLDFCSSADRSIWLAIVFDGPEISTHPHLAKLLLLLYAPLDHRGNIMWDFFEDDMDFASYTEDYKMIAEILAYLILPTRRSYSPDELVDLIESVTGLPTQWPSRSVAALLLCLHCTDSKPVITFFKKLSSSEQMGLAVEILTDVIYIASDFISSEPFENPLITNRSVLNLIRNAINCGWSQEDRKVIVQETWSEIRELSVTMLDEAILIGNGEDVHSLMETWKEICVQLTY